MESKFQLKNEYAVKPFKPSKLVDPAMEFSVIVPGGEIPSGCLHVDQLAIQASNLISQLGRRSYVYVSTRYIAVLF